MRCYRCMKEFDKEYEICPHCGYINSTEAVEPFQLPPGTMLQNRYWIGMMIGFGGFGITYKAFDTKLNVTVAIKEYYPAGRVNRIQGRSDVIVYAGPEDQEYTLGMNRFLEEARHLAKFSKHPNIVNVYNYFQENGTGYIVMEFLDGVSMRYFMDANEGKLSVLYAKEIILATAQALQTLHKAGILHRDISPDNIFLCSDGKIKLIDFGISRLSGEKEDTRSIIVKPGYAPVEQYQRQSKQGPWTDIYALGATFYRALTGRTPEESIERQKKDTLIRPSNYNPEVPEYIDTAIMKSMAVDVEERFARIDEFIDVLLNHKVIRLPEEEKQIKARRKQMISVASAFGMVLVFGILVFGYMQIKQGKHLKADIDIWICAEDDESAKLLQSYYQEISEQLICVDYPNIVVSVHVETQENYEDELLEAFINEEAPDIFESTGLDDKWLSYCTDLSGCVQQINKEKEFYFLDDYETYFPQSKQLPIGFGIPVQYVISDEDGTIIEELSAYSSVEDYYEVQEKVYGSFANPVQQVTGKLRVLPHENADKQYDFSTLLSVNEESTMSEKRAAMLYLQYLLSYRGQMLLHAREAKMDINESRALSVNCKADLEYRHDIYKELSGLDEQLLHFAH